MRFLICIMSILKFFNAKCYNYLERKQLWGKNIVLI